MKEINITELKNALEDSFQLVDIRDEIPAGSSFVRIQIADKYDSLLQS